MAMPMHHRKRIGVWVALYGLVAPGLWMAAILVAVSGCGKATAPTPVLPPGLVLPAGFPDDVPILPGWQQVAVSPIAGVDGFEVTATSSGAPADVLERYRESAEALGWAVHANVEEAEGVAVMSLTQSGRAINVTATAGDGVTSVALSTAARPRPGA